ncbi:histidinol-phosphate transaminase [Mesorhizobium australafricanum]|uniref:Histidinol-phosphate aminotransferase n=1 Tax=Mesorhizobium australafricanum TaxID=3072311 RepID=A0ABU4WTS5_9HYPH|nr:histidinol-phosphate transaminase [Mesorhizobium sp. VK3E]MDX8439452.1 histidinol-phosphate transaminase [Mesorhizobium sp. VK3E]
MDNSVETASQNGLAFNPNVAALPPYNAGMNIAVARSISGRDDIARLASNENPDGCSPAVLAVLASPSLEPWRYADPACAALRAALGQKLSVEPGTIVVGNGSEELIAAVSRAMLVPGASVATVVPSFGLHEIEPLAQGAVVTKVAMTYDLGFDLAALEEVIASGPRVVFLSSPWNPVGPALDRGSLQRLIAAVRPGTLFVLDEAYFEFADHSCPDGLEVLRASEIPFVVLRTFSKAYGLAGLRVGYAICSNAALARVVAAAKTPFNVNVAAQAAAIAALGDEAWMLASVARLRGERARVGAVLEGLGFQIAPSQTNFLFLDCDGDSATVASALLREGIIVKAWREKGYENYLRITIGAPADNDRLIGALARIARR